MSKIRGKETTIEKKARLYLYHHGIRYRKNSRNIPGKPDISVEKYKIAIFVNGCFWHGHQDCKYYRIPKTNTEYWVSKIDRNIERDNKVKNLLKSQGWKVITIWECQLKKTIFEETMANVLHEIQKVKLKASSSDKSKDIV